MTAMLLCPACGAGVALRSAALPYVTCSYCHSLILRHGDQAESIGTVAVLPFDISPLQIGTSGQWRGIGFTLVGRVRWGWSDGSWNEWLAECNDGQHRWLAEAMGSFMLTQARADLLDLPELRGFATGGTMLRGNRVDIDGSAFLASDIKEAQCLGSEGSLPIPSAIGQRMTSVDFRSPDGAALCLQRDETGASAWLGEYLDLAALTPANLRALEGWTIPAPSA